MQINRKQTKGYKVRVNAYSDAEGLLLTMTLVDAMSDKDTLPPNRISASLRAKNNEN